MNVKDSVFVVTGASSGLGEATATLLIQSGAKVVIADLNRETGDKVVARLGANTRFAATDVADEKSAQAAIDLAVSAFGRIDGLVNCAGVGTPGKVLGKNGPLDLGAFTKVVQINLVGTFNMARLAALAMSKQQPNEQGERGVIINTASVAAYEGQIGQPAYAASKAGVVGMTLPIARELAAHGIRMVTIAPGLFETPMLMGLPVQVQTTLASTIPFPKRLGKATEYAALVKHIAENTMLNGETIRLDGALRMGPT